MSSPRSMWSGAVRLGLLNVPVTIGKGWSDERETSLRDYCPEHKNPIQRNERCEGCGGKPEHGKVKGVEGPDGNIRLLNANEFATIEDSTKATTLDVLDVQPLDDLPLDYATGTYYLRSDKKAPGSEQPFKVLAEAMELTGFGLVVKWCSSRRQRLCVLSAHDGMIRLRTIPYRIELRDPGEQEIRHQDAAVDAAHVKMAVQLLKATKGRKKFDHSAYSDEGVTLRREAVERILDGKGEPVPVVKQAEPAPDIMAALSASLESVKAEA